MAAELSRALGVPWDVYLVRKLGVPGREELAMGAVASGGEIVRNQDVIQELGIPEQALQAAVRREEKEIIRRDRVYREQRPEPRIQNRIILLTDDGLATGATMQAAVLALRSKQPKKIVMAVPVAPPEICRRFVALVDDVICLHTPDFFLALSQWYEHFSQTTDEEVRELLLATQKGSE